MKVLNLSKYFPPYPGGIENIACDLVEELAGRGVFETVLSHGDKEYPGSSINQVLSASYGELLYAPISPSFPFKLHKELKSGRYDLLHVHLPNVSAFWPLLMKVDIPIVLHWHADVIFPEDKQFCRAAYKFYAFFERALLKKAAAIVPTSTPYLEHSAPLQEFRHKCSVIPLGLDFSRMAELPDTALIETKRRWTGEEYSFLVVAAGRFSHYKGFSYLIEAAAGLEGVKIVIAGDGEERAGLLQLVDELGLADKVVLPGRLTDHDLHLLMACCDAFCLPSVERSEAFGVVLLEAMFYGRPLITTEINGSATSWVNRAGETGLTIPVGDSAALAEAIKQLRDDPQLCARFGRAGRIRLEKNFTISKTADKFYRLYSGLL
ncbi:glycosyltransferase [Desulfovibrio sp. JC022]|uniref:glycosyltransferase n=1 Tax=Desulfovibrio sp. JC022 TaxID=2593642 RepID=UPI0013CF453C|nr:glycosyltransferase [Desulfovibrio sp. JC022]NDV24936.1 glycosyltransferase [Desulfovibrio sp. JC022]